MRNSYVFLIVLIFCLSSCDHSSDTEKVNADFSGSLSVEEEDSGILTPEILWKFGRMSDHKLSPDGKSIIFSLTRYDYKTNLSVIDICLLSSEGGEYIKLTDSEESSYNARWRPDGSKIGYISESEGNPQIWEMNPDGTDKKVITGIEGGVNGFEYSPNGKSLFFIKDVKLDITPQEKYPDLPLVNVRIIDDLMYRHWNTWHDYAYSHIFIADLKNGELTNVKDIMEDEPWDAPMSPYFDQAEISWSPDGKLLAYTCKKMRGKDYAVSTNSDIYVYNLNSGQTENITKGMPGYDKYPVFSNDSKFIAWQSMETPGYEADKNRLFVMDMNTGEKSYLTSEFDQDAEHLVWGENDDIIYFITGTEATYQIAKIDVNTKEITQLTSGDHNYQSFNLGEDFITGEKMSMSMATELFRIEKNGEEKKISSVNQNIYDHIRMGKVEERWVTTTDNKKMKVWVIFPPDFDSSKKYPTLLYCQGGPQSAVSQFFSYRWNFQIMAANGYIIVAPNRRGLPTFGSEWNKQISGDYGGQNIKDYLSAIDAVATEEFVDEKRLGAVGASYGGYSVFYLAGHHDGRFKAFISHCGIYNFESMYTATEETFFVHHDLEGAYWEKPRPKSYEFSPHLYVDKWDTPIMIITGENDLRIPYTESLQAFNAAQLRDIPSKLLVFPEETHFVLKPQNSILWQREFFGWLDSYLK